MDREKLFESLFECEGDHIVDIVKRMSTYLDDEQLCDCMRTALMRRCSSDVEYDINIAVEYAVEISYDDVEVSNEDIIWNVVNSIREQFSYVIPLYLIGEGEYANMFISVYSCFLTKETIMRTLKEVNIGETVKVVKITGEGPIKRRIMDMGITKGTEIYIRKVAPLGDPIEVTIRGYELSLRKADIDIIQVEDK